MDLWEENKHLNHQTLDAAVSAGIQPPVVFLDTLGSARNCHNCKAPKYQTWHPMSVYVNHSPYTWLAGGVSRKTLHPVNQQQCTFYISVLLAYIKMYEDAKQVINIRHLLVLCFCNLLTIYKNHTGMKWKVTAWSQTLINITGIHCGKSLERKFV